VFLLGAHWVVVVSLVEEGLGGWGVGRIQGRQAGREGSGGEYNRKKLLYSNHRGIQEQGLSVLLIREQIHGQQRGLNFLLIEQIHAVPEGRRKEVGSGAVHWNAGLCREQRGVKKGGYSPRGANRQRESHAKNTAADQSVWAVCEQQELKRACKRHVRACRQDRKALEGKKV